MPDADCGAGAAAGGGRSAAPPVDAGAGRHRDAGAVIRPVIDRVFQAVGGHLLDAALHPWCAAAVEGGEHQFHRQARRHRVDAVHRHPRFHAQRRVVRHDFHQGVAGADHRPGGVQLQTHHPAVRRRQQPGVRFLVARRRQALLLACQFQALLGQRLLHVALPFAAQAIQFRAQFAEPALRGARRRFAGGPLAKQRGAADWANREMRDHESKLREFQAYRNRVDNLRDTWQVGDELER